MQWYRSVILHRIQVSPGVLLTSKGSGFRRPQRSFYQASPSRNTSTSTSTSTSAHTQRRYAPTLSDDIESPENYHPGGFHPVAIGDTFCRGRYKVLHKLGFGASSTTWLTRDQKTPHPESLVTLKVTSAELDVTRIPDVSVSSQLDKYRERGGSVHPGSGGYSSVRDHFLHGGPNGLHLCLVSEFLGPSLSSVLSCPGRTAGSRRLRGDLARKIGRQVAQAVDFVHSAGVVHGDLTTSNILFRVTDEVHEWSDEGVCLHLGFPETESIATLDGSPPGPGAPSYLVSPIDTALFYTSSLLQEQVLLTDFGQSFIASRRPTNYEPATAPYYFAPETIFDSQFDSRSDIWSLACTLYEIRTGSPLFDNFFVGNDWHLKQNVEILGKLPGPWWDAWKARGEWFDEKGDAKLAVEQGAQKTTLRQKLCEVGTRDDPPLSYEGDMFEETGTRLGDDEIDLFADLLQRMLKYRPEERITAGEVVQHPWFSYGK